MNASTPGHDPNGMPGQLDETASDGWIAFGVVGRVVRLVLPVRYVFPAESTVTARIWIPSPSPALNVNVAGGLAANALDSANKRTGARRMSLSSHKYLMENPPSQPSA